MTKKLPPRKVPTRDDKYMGLAFWMASFSKDPSTQVGAVVVSTDNIPLGWGYNGPPRSIRDNDVNWDRPYKYDFIVHAEENAIDHCLRSPNNATLDVTAIPCPNCMLKIVQYGIKKVVYFHNKSLDLDKESMTKNEQLIEKTREIARLATPIVQLSEFDGNLNWMRDRMVFMEELGIFDD